MINIFQRVEKQPFVYIDDWKPEKEDMIVNECKGYIIIPVSKLYGLDAEMLDRFDISTKRGYNSSKIRSHIVHYINYFLKYYDYDKELLNIYGTIKYLTDFEPCYNEQAFQYDLDRYIFSNMSLDYKISCLNRENYKQNMKFNNKKNPNLQYNDEHGLVLMKLCVTMNIVIPLITHFAAEKNISDINTFILKIYDILLGKFDVDIYNKFYETCISNILSNKNLNPIWEDQDIRSINTTTHAISSVHDLLINIIPKYNYEKNPVIYNYVIIKNNIGFQITNIPYEYDLFKLSSSDRDEDQNSEFDKFESNLIKQDESLFIQNEVNFEQTMKYLESRFIISQEEIDFYNKELSKDGNENIINNFQKKLIFNLFYKYFGDVASIKSLNREDYIKLMIIAKRILIINNLHILPYIISSRIVRFVDKKNLNKREYLKLTSSKDYVNIINTYQNDKIIKYIHSIIGTIIASEFEYIDMDPYINGRKIDTKLTDLVIEEIRMYISLVAR